MTSIDTSIDGANRAPQYWWGRIGERVLLPPARPATGPRAWWETRAFVMALVLLAIVPLLYPPIPPLVDLFGHMGRYRVQLDLHSSPWLKDYYDFHWAAIGNLGVDLLVMPLAPIFGLEMAVKLIVIAIPALTVAGFLWVAREVHDRIPPTALFALPFAYSHPFMFGFVNFALSMALAFLAFGLWLRLARKGRLRLRAILFVPISLAIFFTHTFGWGTLGLLCFSAEAVRLHDEGTPWFRAGLGAAVNASVMALPLVVMLAWRSETHGGMTRDWFDWEIKAKAIAMSLRDRWPWFDIASMLAAAAVMVEAVRNPRLGFSRNLAFSALVLLLGFILLPRVVFGSAYADMRLAPYMIAVALLAIRFRDRIPIRTAQALLVLGLAFFLVRIGSNTISLAMASDAQQEKLQAIDRVPMGSAVATIVGTGCRFEWTMPRDGHLGAMVIVRRQGFSNDQWVTEGMNLLDLNYKKAGLFGSDPSEMVDSDRCRNPGSWKIDQALRQLPREAFDYVWLIHPPAFDPSLVAGMKPVWRGRDSVLLQVRP